MDQQTQQRIYADSTAANTRAMIGEMAAANIDMRAQLDLARMQLQEMSGQLTDAQQALAAAQSEISVLKGMPEEAAPAPPEDH